MNIPARVTMKETVEKILGKIKNNSIGISQGSAYNRLNNLKQADQFPLYKFY